MGNRELASPSIRHLSRRLTTSERIVGCRMVTARINYRFGGPVSRVLTSLNFQET